MHQTVHSEMEDDSDAALRPERRKHSILIINPNTTQAMTDALRPLIDSLSFHETEFSYFTAPSGVPSINNEEDGATSTEACLPALKQHLAEYDGFLVCCYSKHLLVPCLRKEILDAGLDGKVVTGIFEASIATCLQSIDAYSKFGIVSTGMQWEAILKDAVADLLGSQKSSRYAGTETTGLNADQLHTTSKEEVDRLMREATRRSLQKGVEAICLGCAGMASMQNMVRQACVDVLGEREGRRIKIVDGVVSGVIFLEGALRGGL